MLANWYFSIQGLPVFEHCRQQCKLVADNPACNQRATNPMLTKEHKLSTSNALSERRSDLQKMVGQEQYILPKECLTLVEQLYKTEHMQLKQH